MTQPLTETASWRALQAHYEKIKDVQLRQLFAGDPGRGGRLVAESASTIRRTGLPTKPSAC